MRMSDEASLFNDGADYERLMGRWSRLIGRQFLDWLAPAKGLSWLDVGCGNGAFAEEIIARCAPAKVSAVDPSEGQIAFAGTRPSAKIAEFRVADAQSLPFEHRSFDVVAMALVISFVPDPAKAVAEMVRVARPGGTVASYMWDLSMAGSPLEPIYRAISKVGSAAPRPRSQAVSTRPAQQELWTKAGLQAVETRHMRTEAIFSSVEDYWEATAVPVGPQGMVINRLSPEARERLRDALRHELTPGPDGRIAVPCVASAVKGRVPQ
jgi:ubiquinone/menaquinone biosynthesis C-methylase UbiE